MSAIHYYVYYKFDPARIEEVRALVLKVFGEVRASTGVQGEWQRRRDDPSTFMEIYADVSEADVFQRALDAALDAAGFAQLAERLGIHRITEVFQCA